MSEEKQYNLNMSFNTSIAIKYGVNESIFLNNLIFWISVNKANNSNFHDGKTWSYNSMDAFTRIFPFWSIGQIKRIIDSLKEYGVIVSGNYNQSPYNRTMWYALADESILFIEKSSDKTSIVCNQKMDENVLAFPNSDNKETLTDELPNTNTNINNTNTLVNEPLTEEPKRKSFVYDDQKFNELWNTYPNRDGVKGSKQEAYKKFTKLTVEQKDECLKAVINYKLSGQKPRDVVRFVSDEYWLTWLNYQPTVFKIPTKEEVGEYLKTSSFEDYEFDVNIMYEFLSNTGWKTKFNELIPWKNILIGKICVTYNKRKLTYQEQKDAEYYRNNLVIPTEQELEKMNNFTPIFMLEDNEPEEPDNNEELPLDFETNPMYHTIAKKLKDV